MLTVSFFSIVCYLKQQKIHSTFICLICITIFVLLNLFSILVLITLSLFDFAESPEFVLKLPLHTFVKQCDPVRLECKVTSGRSLKMCWYKNDKKITDGDNYRTSFADTTAVLQMLTARFDDKGVYTCEAQNDAGSISCSTILAVQG